MDASNSSEHNQKKIEKKNSKDINIKKKKMKLKMKTIKN